MRRKPPSLTLLKSIYDYNQETGEFIYRCNRGKRGKKGTVAGARRKDGYIGITLGPEDGKKVYLAHQLAWYYVYGTTTQIDHINHIRTDNKIKNLRPATALQNGANNKGVDLSTKKYKLPRGVYYDFSKSKKPFAAIRVYRRLRNIGYFETVEEAQIAYIETSLWIHGDFSPFWNHKQEMNYVPCWNESCMC